MIILGIETSCDDTSLCLLNGEGKILSHLSFSSSAFLNRWGGVVPEIAARDHAAKIPLLLESVFSEAKLTIKDVNLIGVTTKPGLLGPLLTGINTAKTLSLIHKIPIYPVNHLHAHLEAIHLSSPTSYPYLGVLLSGGNSAFFLVESSLKFEILGTTIDDAAGEAFDKGGKLLNFAYPAGRIIDETAKKGDPFKYSFPIGLKNAKDENEFNFSYSGIKTALKLIVSKYNNINDIPDLPDIVASYQHAIIEAVQIKLANVLEKKVPNKNIPIVVGGGVACNSYLRHKLNEKYQTQVKFVPPALCMDNGAMIAFLALKNASHAVPYPQCLKIDALERYIQKTSL
ncbi:MAG: tRNA (adenosine(37)-N6)-threonylcarbamoyltransferase complex transferase subunit TsaD [Bacteriovoracaceae bacterium]